MAIARRVYSLQAVYVCVVLLSGRVCCVVNMRHGNRCCMSLWEPFDMVLQLLMHALALSVGVKHTAPMRTHGHTCTYTQAHTHTHGYMHAHTHTDTCTHTHTHGHVHAHTHTP